MIKEEQGFLFLFFSSVCFLSSNICMPSTPVKEIGYEMARGIRMLVSSSK